MTAVHKRANYQRARIDRALPYQVALPDEFCCMENYTVIAEFCRRFDPAPEHRSITAIWPDGTQKKMRLHCFASRADAEVFAAHFEGEHFDPVRDRGKGERRDAWRRTGSWVNVDHFGPLKLPRFFRDNP